MCIKSWKYKENYADPTVQSEQQVTNSKPGSQRVESYSVIQAQEAQKQGQPLTKMIYEKTISFKDHQIPCVETDFFQKKKKKGILLRFEMKSRRDYVSMDHLLK